ncbi:Uncharacterised protein [Chlamydia trachomatis]|nr:Uncharacterised protein [Chlamydia trachomatis]
MEAARGTLCDVESFNEDGSKPSHCNVTDDTGSGGTTANDDNVSVDRLHHSFPSHFRFGLAHS